MSWVDGVVKIVEARAVFILGACFALFVLKDKLPTIIKAIKKDNGITQIFQLGKAPKGLPSTDLSKVFSESPPWDLATTCNMEEICFVSDSQKFSLQIQDFVDRQRALGINLLTFNFMKVKKINTQFCDAFVSSVLRFLADDNVVIRIVIPVFAGGKIKVLKNSVQKIINGTNKNTISIRDGLRENDR